MSSDTIGRWHELVTSGEIHRLRELLDDDVVFWSPVVHTPQHGKEITYQYLKAALSVLGTADFRYERELHGENESVLEFSTKIDGLIINGVDMIRCNDAGKIIDFKVMVRPLKAIQAVHQQMGATLARYQSIN